MSATDFQPQVESRSKIKVVKNAKGDAQWEVSVISGEMESTLDEMRAQAVAQYKALERDLG